MFESLSDRLGSVVSKLRNRGRLSEADVDEILGVTPSNRYGDARGGAEQSVRQLTGKATAFTATTWSW